MTTAAMRVGEGPVASLLYDLQAFPGDDPARVYSTVLEQAAWADRHGFASISFPEHHGTDHGYLPSPVVMAAAVAAVTTHLRLSPAALVLPLHDVVRVAEDVAVLDLVSGGRAEPVFGAGYVPAEFAMFGADLGCRGRAMEEGVDALRRAWTGEPFEHLGRPVRVTPRPVQRPHPPIVLGGTSAAAARRAARIADGFRPALPGVWDAYRAECLRLGKADPGPARASGPFFLHVAIDPERAVAAVEPAVVRGVNQYLELSTVAYGGPPLAVGTYHEAAALGMARIVDPDECVRVCHALGPGGNVLHQPLFGGLSPELSWSSLELFVESVLPRLEGGATRAIRATKEES